MAARSSRAAVVACYSVQSVPQAGRVQHLPEGNLRLGVVDALGLHPGPDTSRDRRAFGEPKAHLIPG